MLQCRPESDAIIQFYSPRLSFVSPVPNELLKECLKRNASRRARRRKVEVERVYRTGLTAALNGRINTAIQAYTCNRCNNIQYHGWRIKHGYLDPPTAKFYFNDVLLPFIVKSL